MLKAVPTWSPSGTPCGRRRAGPGPRRLILKTKTAHLGDAQALYAVYRDSPDYFQMLGTEIPTAAEVELSG